MAYKGSTLARMSKAASHSRPSGDGASFNPDHSFTGFLNAVKKKDFATLKTYNTKAVLGENSGATGGYLVPREHSMRLLQVVAEESFIWDLATVVPMTSATIDLPKIDVETAPSAAGISPFFGGLTFTWGSEQAPSETEPKFRGLTLRAWDLLGYCVVSNSFLHDIGPEGEHFLINLFGQAAAWYAEFAFLRGPGVDGKMPLGILNSTNSIKLTNRAVGNQIAQADIAGMASNLLPFAWSNAIWATHPTCLSQIVNMANYFVNGGGMNTDGSCGSLLTRPLFVTEKLPALGTPGDLILFDPRLYVIGDRMQVVVDVSDQVSFRTNQTNFRVWLRCDGRPWLGSNVTLQDTSSTVAGYVVLN